MTDRPCTFQDCHSGAKYLVQVTNRQGVVGISSDMCDFHATETDDVFHGKDGYTLHRTLIKK